MTTFVAGTDEVIGARNGGVKACQKNSPEKLFNLELKTEE